ncbi:MAG: DUF3943 domain-containing protein [Candidatus Delongbacteria bacterium]|jgi:hypothetical protein|nr:DUF3943 domain-containing protein [Candidatus Delongbacteria bacterium]
MRCKTIIIILLFSLSNLLFCVQNETPKLDSSKKFSILWPLTQVLATNSVIGLSNNFIGDAQFAKISFESIENNVCNPWVWDDDGFTVNQIGHPLQGSLYYSLARNKDHSYFGSIPFVAIGSIHWEYIMETERPAINDLITTTLGGAMLGEIIFRISDEILDDTSSGIERFVRETSVFTLNPMRGLNRLISGKTFISSGNTERKIISPLKLSFSTSKNLFNYLISENIVLDNSDSLKQTPFADYFLRLKYGDPFMTRKAFDYFLLNIGFSLDYDVIQNVSARGLLWKRNIKLTDIAHSALGIFQNFDYLTSSDYKVAASSFGFEFMARSKSKKHWQLSSEYQAGFIILGAASTEYFIDVDRDYNLGPGGFVKIIMSLTKPDFGNISVNLNRFFIRTISGAEGVESFGIGRIEIQKILLRKFGLGIAYIFYDREGYYRNHPNISVFNHEIKGIISYNLF